jgi:O-antigen biosynthesis protein
MKDEISVVTVNYNGKRYLDHLLQSLKKQTYFNNRIIVVDNGSTDDSVAFLMEKYPEVKIVRNKKNLGFAGGNNSALPFINGKYIALINNDMVADETWLENMHNSMINNDADAVGAKILFYKPFVSLRIETHNFIPSDNNMGSDSRSLGCKISSDISIANVEYKKTIFFNGTYGEEISDGLNFHWVSDTGIIKIPVDLGLDDFLLKFKIAVSTFQRSQYVKIFIADTLVWENNVTDKFTAQEVIIDVALIKENAKFIINNAGSEFDFKNGYGKDIGMFEDDNGQFNQAHEAFSLCGGSMLIRKTLIDRIGLFDKYFFAYYEDTDFSWRVKKVKGKMFYESSAIVYHIHTGTSKEWSPFFRYHVERNRLAMLLKNAGLLDALREWCTFFLRVVMSVPFFLHEVIFIKKESEKKIIYQINFVVALDLFLHMPILVYKRCLNNLRN